jgi:hypothetical protein
MVIPTPTNKTSAETSLPLMLPWHSSDWYIGTVEVSSPVPMPVIMRPITKWGILYAEHYNTAPIMMIEAASQMTFFRPKGFPIQKLTIKI